MHRCDSCICPVYMALPILITFLFTDKKNLKNFKGSCNDLPASFKPHLDLSLIEKSFRLRLYLSLLLSPFSVMEVCFVFFGQ